MNDPADPNEGPFDKPALANVKGDGYEIIEGHRVFHKGSAYPFKDYKPYFKVDTYRIKHRRYDNKDPTVVRREIFERGDAVGVLLYNRDQKVVVAVEQFRLPTINRGNGNGWIVETIAGEIPTKDGKPTETPEQTAIREVWEEVGYAITKPIPIAEFFSSPGGTSEKIHLFFAEVGDNDRKGPGGGKGDEDIRPVVLGLVELADKILKRELVDPKLVIASYYLQARLGLRIETDQILKPDASSVVHAWGKYPGATLAIKTGDILKVSGVDIWLNPENRYMMMSRIIDEGLSASIRWGGARKYSKSRLVAEDTIGNALRVQMGGRSEFKYYDIIETEPGELRSLGVKRLLHLPIAQAKGPMRAREGLLVQPKNIRPTLLEALKVAHDGRRGKCTSVLIPLIGAGEGGMTAHGSVAAILAVIEEFLAEFSSKTTLKQFYLLAYKQRDLDACIEETEKFFKK